MKYRGYKVPNCNCGGPESGTGHSPDCLYVLGCDDVDHEIADRDQEVSHDTPFGEQLDGGSEVDL